MEQVWKATTLNNLKVVVKIYQGCFQNTPMWVKQKGMKVIAAFIPEEERAHREAWAYNRLKSLQGLCIPHSYGFFEVDIYHLFRTCQNLLPIT